MRMHAPWLPSCFDGRSFRRSSSFVEMETLGLGDGGTTIGNCLSQPKHGKIVMNFWVSRQKNLKKSYCTFFYFVKIKTVRSKAVKFHEGFVCLPNETNSRCWNR